MLCLVIVGCGLQRYSLSITMSTWWISFIDYVLTFERDVPEDKKWSAEDLSERQKKREMKRAEFLDNLEAIGIEHEVEQPKAVKKAFDFSYLNRQQLIVVLE